MLDQEIASIMHYIINAASTPTPLNPYYHNIPEDFSTPAVFFPQPEVTSHGDTLNTYALEFSWFIVFFDKDTQSTHSLALAALTVLQEKKCVVPRIDEKGQSIGRGIRLNDPSVRVIDDGAAQLTLNWKSPRPYFRESVEKMMIYHTSIWIKSAFNSAVNQIVR